MNCNCYNVSHLPDIDMYGGDTTPWQVNMINKDGTPYIIPQSDVSYYSAKLVFCPLKTSYGMSSNASSDNIMLEIDGDIVRSDTRTAAVFFFKPSDTIHLRGKFTYQVEFKYSDEDTGTDDVIKINQGIVYVKQNLDIGNGVV